MYVCNLKNVSVDDILIRTKNGVRISLPPGQEINNMDVTNLNELRNKISYTADLTEINRSNSTKIALYD